MPWLNWQSMPVIPASLMSDVKANIIDKVYMIGKKAVEDFKKFMRILFDDHLGQWNYVAVPQQG